ncbi:MAG: hypothetical protein ACRDRQ_15445 [Pseudonocardiaceae bacterium]
MSDPRTPEGGAGVRVSVSGRLDWTHDNALFVAQRVTRLPSLSLAVALDHLDAAGLCARWAGREGAA